MEDISDYKLLATSKEKDTKALRDILIGLSPFQIRFIEQYIRTGSAGQAARLAGSEAKNPETVGYKMLQDERIIKAISIAMKKRIEAVGLDSVEVIMKIREVYDAAMEAGKFQDANKACELLQKEIERASKAAEVPSQAKGKLDKLKTDGVEVSEELDKVINIISNIPRI